MQYGREPVPGNRRDDSRGLTGGSIQVRLGTPILQRPAPQGRGVRVSA